MKIKVIVPTSLADIKLSQYQKFLRTTEGSEDVRFINRQLVGIFCGLSDELVEKISKKDYDNIISNITNIITDDKKYSLKTIINHNGKEYGFIPKLDDITVGEQADIDSMLGDWQKMQKVMGVMYRPITSKRGDKYLIGDYEPNELDLTMDVVQGALVFFYRLVNALVICTQSYIKEEVIIKNSQILEENGVGINQFTESLGEIFLNLRKLLNYDYMKHSYF
jgi:hypothetical protein